MKFILRFVMLASILATFALTCTAQVYPAPEGGFYTEYDSFKDQTTSWLMQLEVAEKKYDFDYQRLYLSAWSAFPSTRPNSRPRVIGFMLASWSLFNDRYTEPSPLDAIIDGQRKSFGTSTPISRKVINGKYVGWMC